MPVDDNRPPYVTFEEREIEDRPASIAAGHYVAKPFDVAIITRPGNRDTVEKEASVFLKEMRERSRLSQIPPTWYDAFEAAYKNWKNGETGTVDGTPIKGWPAIGAAQQKTLLAAGIMSVEDLAALPDGAMDQIGMGAIGLKAKAKAWLEASNNTGKVAEEINALRVQVEQLVSLTQQQAQEINKLRPKPL